MKEQNIHRMTLIIPFTILYLIDERINKKLKDGENKLIANRTVFTLNMLKLSAKILKKKEKT